MEKAGDQSRRWFDQQPDTDVRSCAEPLQVGSEPSRAPMELGMGQAVLLEHHSWCRGRATGASLDQLVQAEIVTHSEQAMSSFMISFVPA